MKVEDRLAIQDLYARISVALDTGDEHGWVYSFTDDVALYARAEVHGRTDLVDFFHSRMTDRQTDPTVNTQHWTTNLVLSGEPPLVRAFCYLMKVGQPRGGGPLTIVTVAVYKDVLRKVGDEWLIAQRRVIQSMPSYDQLWQD